MTTHRALTRLTLLTSTTLMTAGLMAMLSPIPVALSGYNPGYCRPVANSACANVGDTTCAYAGSGQIRCSTGQLCSNCVTSDTFAGGMCVFTSSDFPNCTYSTVSCSNMATAYCVYNGGQPYDNTKCQCPANNIGPNSCTVYTCNNPQQ